jgi:alpha-L-fucosidase 2
VGALSSTVVLPATTAPVLEFAARASTTYLVRRSSDGAKPLPFAPISTTPATAPKTLGTRSIGIAR